MKDIKVNFKSSYQDNLNNDSYEQAVQGVLIKDDLITSLRFYLEDDYYMIIIKENEISIYKRGNEQIDMLFNQDFFMLKYYVGEEMVLEGKMKLYHCSDNQLVLEYYLSDDQTIVNRIEIDFKEE